MHTLVNVIVSAGAVSGLLAGTLFGAIITLLLVVGGDAPFSYTALVLPPLFGALAGSLGGALFGLLISQGMTEDDLYLYENSRQQNGVIVAVQTLPAQLGNVRQILHLQRNQERPAAAG